MKYRRYSLLTTVDAHNVFWSNWSALSTCTEGFDSIPIAVSNILQVRPFGHLDTADALFVQTWMHTRYIYGTYVKSGWNCASAKSFNYNRMTLLTLYECFMFWNFLPKLTSKKSIFCEAVLFELNHVHFFPFLRETYKLVKPKLSLVKPAGWRKKRPLVHRSFKILQLTVMLAKSIKNVIFLPHRTMTR